MEISLAVAGLLIGTMIGLTGMGGGALMTPFLILVLGTRPVVAVGTDLVYGAVTKIFGAGVHWQQGTVDVKLAGRLALASIPAGLAAVVVLHAMPPAGIDMDGAVRRALGAVLIVVAAVLLARVSGVLPTDIPERWRAMLRRRGTLVVGGTVGALVGFTSVGSGSLLVPFLVLALPSNAARVVGTDVFHAALLVSVTALGHAQAGAVDWPLAANLLVGSVPGVAIGSWAATRVPAKRLVVGLAGLLLVTGFSLAWPSSA